MLKNDLNKLPGLSLTTRVNFFRIRILGSLSSTTTFPDPAAASPSKKQQNQMA
jgi:hypothetical protein